MTLNKIIGQYLKTNRISCLLVENDYVVNRYGTDGEYWNRVNIGICQSLKNIQDLTDSDINLGSDYGSLDKREMMRIIHSGGLLDIRTQGLFSLVTDNIKTSKFESLTSGKLSINSTRGYIIAVGFPHFYKGAQGVPEFLNEVFKKLKRITHSNFVLKSSYYSKDLLEIKIDVLLSGLSTKPIERQIEKVQIELDRLNNKKTESIDISQLGRLRI